MLFVSYWFYLFAAVVITAYWLLPWKPLRLYFLLLVSIIFQYHFAGFTGTITTVALAVMVYFAGLNRNPYWIGFAMVVCTGALIVFKYSHFVTLRLIGPIFPGWGAAADHLAIECLPPVAPLAISFFTFEFIHYLYDIRSKSEPIRKPLDFALFIFFFPTLVAGPIKRFEQFVPQLGTSAARFNLSEITYGLVRIAIGFFKKVVMADSLTTYCLYYDDHLDQATLSTRWTIFLFLGLRIYMDFSGYSDIALGLARMLGFRLPENFNWPYSATNLQDFWHRWHISLSSWIRDYIYIPLGGSRHGLIRRGFNVFFAFALCGLWHGPEWNFVLWGIMHGVGLCTNILYGKIPVIGPALESFFRQVPFAGWLLTMIFVFLSWILFFYPLDKAGAFLFLLFSPDHN